MSSEKLRLADSYPCFSDWVSATPYDPHYFHQGAWLARRIAEERPELHVDIGSSVLTVGVMSAQVPTVFVDYRPLNVKLSNMLNVGGSIASLPFVTGSIKSLSCMHVLEHIGLGRYGDPIDPDGARKGAAELARVLAPGGRLYLTTPVGRERVCFNAHRVFSPTGLPELLPGLALRNFSWVDDAGGFNLLGRPDDAVADEYACGFYEFEKLYD
jgi:SAM-dependent methyltransferase